MKTSKEWARVAWAHISLGNIARPANQEQVVEELSKFFAQAMKEYGDEWKESFEIVIMERANRFVKHLFD